MPKVAQYVRVKAGFSRSINIERDQSTAALLDSYVISSCALKGLDHVVNAFQGAKDCDKAWSLIGAYGSGKSSFALYLSHLFGDPKKADTKRAFQKLEPANAGCAKAIKSHLRGSSGYCRILLTGYPESLARAFLQALKKGIQAYYADHGIDRRAEVREINRLLKQDSIDLSAIVRLIKRAQKSIQNAKGKGLLIVIDELGKFLEYAARHESDDIFLLQILAEQTHQTGQSNILLFVLLHQSFEQYGHNLSDKLKNEWTKIQGRYQILTFVETTEQSLRIMAQVLDSRLPKNRSAQIKKQVESFVVGLSATGLLPRGLSEKEALKLFLQCYPLHPITLLLLPVLSRKIAQNERSLFGYLGSSATGGLVDQMRHADVGQFICPEAIYDYFMNGQLLTNDLYTQRVWFEAATAMDRLAGGNATEVLLLKTISLFNIAGNVGRLKASKPALKLCFQDSRSLDAAIKSLMNQSIVTFRKFNHEYRVWQGSDFDLRQALSEQEPFTRTMDIAHELNAMEVLQPFVARRYSIERHGLFYFQPQFINVADYEKTSKKANKPRIIFCLSNSSIKRDEKLFREKVTGHFSDQDVVVFCANSEEIKKVCRLRVALQRIGQMPEANQEPVIQREWRSYFANAQRQEYEEIKSLVGRPQQHLWYCDKKERSIKRQLDIQKLLSERLEDIYPRAPVIKNELINRDYPSGQSNYGRRMLLSALLQNRNKESFGIKAYPAEKSMYLAIFALSKIHRQDNGQWEIAPPTPEDPCNFRGVWNAITDFFDSSEKRAKSFSELDARLTDPPYGVKKAMLPVFYMMVYAAYQDEIAVYEEQIYVPYFTVEHLERFLKRPSTFSFQQFRIAGVTQSLIEEYEQSLFAGKKSKNALAVFKPIAQFVSQVPQYTRQTTTISETAQRVRDAFKYPKSPQDLLFEKLPRACGYKSEKIEGFGNTLKKVLQEMKNAYPDMMAEQVKKMSMVFGLRNQDGLHKLRVRARETCEQLREYTMDKTMHAFIDSIATDFGDDESWLERVTALLVDKSPKNWSDNDSLYAQHKIIEYGKKLNDLEKLKVYANENKLEDSQGEAILISIKSAKRQDINQVVCIGSEMSVEQARASMQNAMKEITEKLLTDKRLKPEGKQLYLRLVEGKK